MREVAGDSQLQSQTLEDLSEAVNYRAWLTDLARPFLGPSPLEVGSGLGDYAVEWLPDVSDITVSEGDSGRLQVLRDRFQHEPKVRVRQLTLPDVESADHSSLLAFNVLEHIENDAEALRAAAQLVRPGGAIVLLVPAFEGAMSRFDRAVGHFRRYTVASMRSVIEDSGLELHVVRYVNPVGLIAWFLMMRVLGRTPGNGPLLRLYDGRVVPVLRRLDARHPKPPFGQSVFAVARVPH